MQTIEFTRVEFEESFLSPASFLPVKFGDYLLHDWFKHLKNKFKNYDPNTDTIKIIVADDDPFLDPDYRKKLFAQIKKMNNERKLLTTEQSGK